MLIVALISTSLSFAVPDSTPRTLTTKDLEQSGTVQRVNLLNQLMDYGPVCETGVYEDPRTAKRTIGFKWSIDSVGFENFDRAQKLAFGFDLMVNLHLLAEKELRSLDEMMLYIGKDGDITKYHSFNFLIETEARSLTYTIHERMKILDSLSICSLEYVIGRDWHNPFRKMLRIKIRVPDFLAPIDANITTIKGALQYFIENFVLATAYRKYSRYQLFFSDVGYGKSTYIYRLSTKKRK